MLLGPLRHNWFQSRFLFLNGSKRGWVTVSVLLEKHLFHKLPEAAKSSSGAELLDQWYDCDGNYLPPARKLKRRDAYAKPAQWPVVEKQLALSWKRSKRFCQKKCPTIPPRVRLLWKATTSISATHSGNNRQIHCLRDRI